MPRRPRIDDPPAQTGLAQDLDGLAVGHPTPRRRAYRISPLATERSCSHSEPSEPDGKASLRCCDRDRPVVLSILHSAFLVVRYCPPHRSLFACGRPHRRNESTQKILSLDRSIRIIHCFCYTFQHAPANSETRPPQKKLCATTIYRFYPSDCCRPCQKNDEVEHAQDSRLAGNAGLQ